MVIQLKELQEVINLNTAKFNSASTPTHWLNYCWTVGCLTKEAQLRSFSRCILEDTSMMNELIVLDIAGNESLGSCFDSGSTF